MVEFKDSICKGYVDSEVYLGKNPLIGVNSALLPIIDFRKIAECVSSGNLAEDVMRAMRLRLLFLSVRDAVNALSKVNEQRIEIRRVEERWGICDTELGVFTEKHVFNAIPLRLLPGRTENTALFENVPLGDYTICEYGVNYYAAYAEGSRQLWEIHPDCMICTVGGIDYLSSVREKIGPYTVVK